MQLSLRPPVEASRLALVPAATSVTRGLSAPGLLQLPPIALADPDGFSETDIRSELLGRKKGLREQREDAALAAKGLAHGAPERGGLYKTVQRLLTEEESLESLLQTNFIPQHGPGQLISPRDLFVSPLFRVRSKAPKSSVKGWAKDEAVYCIRADGWA